MGGEVGNYVWGTHWLPRLGKWFGELTLCGGRVVVRGACLVPGSASWMGRPGTVTEASCYWWGRVAEQGSEWYVGGEV